MERCDKHEVKGGISRLASTILSDFAGAAIVGTYVVLHTF